MMRWIRRLPGLPVVLLVLLTGCHSLELEESVADAARLDGLLDEVKVEAPDANLLFLSDDVKQMIDAEISSTWSANRRFRALGRFLFEADQRNIQYDAWSTHSATDTFLNGRGNCLSASALFVAAARHVRVDASFQTVAVRPIWAQASEVVIRYEHIVAVMNVGGNAYEFDFLPNAFVQTGDRKRVSDEQALALFYSNLAVDALVENDIKRSVELGLQALKIWPENSNFWSNLGSAFRRDNQTLLAELGFKRALRLDRSNLSALSNLTYLYVQNGRVLEADQYLNRVERYYRRNPYYHFYLAEAQLAAGNTDAAVDQLKAAIRLNSDDPKLFEALARAYRDQGDTQSAEASEAKARQLTANIKGV